MPAATLQFGKFFGLELTRRDVDGLSVSERTLESGMQSPPEHSHDNAHFVVVLQGEYKIASSQRSAVLDKPLVTYTPPHFVHTDGLRSVGRLLTISFDPDRYRRLAEQIRLPSGEVFIPLGSLWSSVMRLRSELGREDPFSNLISDALCMEIAATALRRSSPHRVSSPLFDKIRELLHHWPAEEPFDLTVIARSVASTTHDVLLAFRKNACCSPGEYLRRRRLELSRQHLLTTTLPLTTIAANAGYADQSAFTKAFTRYEGCSPGTFRRRHGQNRARME